MSREDFEKWASPEFDLTIGRIRVGRYMLAVTRAAWAGWQAALQHRGEPVAEVCWMADRPNSMLEMRCVGDVLISELDVGTKLYTTPQPVVDRNDLIELLIATRTQSEGVTADLIIKLLKAGGESDRG